MAMRAAILCASFAMASCGGGHSGPQNDPVAAAMRPVPSGEVGLFTFRDKVMFTNNTADAMVDCTVTLDGGIRGEIQKIGAGVTVTLMRSRFEPYVEADDFYRRASRNQNTVECTTPRGRQKVSFGGQVETTVVVPPR